MAKDLKPPGQPVSHEEGSIGSVRSGQYFKDIRVEVYTHTHLERGQEVDGHPGLVSGVETAVTGGSQV